LSDATKWEFELATQVLSPDRIFFALTADGRYSTPDNWRPNIWGEDPRILDVAAIRRFFCLFHIEQHEVQGILNGGVLKLTGEKEFQVIPPVPLPSRECSPDPIADALGRALISAGLISAPPWYRILWQPPISVMLGIGMVSLVMILILTFYR